MQSVCIQNVCINTVHTSCNRDTRKPVFKKFSWMERKSFTSLENLERTTTARSECIIGCGSDSWGTFTGASTSCEKTQQQLLNEPKLISDTLPYFVFFVKQLLGAERQIMNFHQPLWWLLLWETDMLSIVHNHRDWLMRLLIVRKVWKIWTWSKKFVRDTCTTCTKTHPVCKRPWYWLKLYLEHHPVHFDTFLFPRH